MALTDDTTMLVQPSGIGNGMFGDNSIIWLLILFILIGGWNGGGYGNGNNAIPYMMNNTVASDVQRGFDQSAIISGINGISTGLCNGFSGVQQSLTNGFAQAEIANNARQMADMQQAFANQTAMMQGFNGMQSQFAQCCCDNRLATCQTQNIVQNEGAATRLAIQEQTQAILDKMCAQEIETLKQQNSNLQTQLNLANLAASQTAQTAALVADNTAQTQYIVNRVAPYPIPSYTVPNPYGTTTASAG